MFPQNPLWYTAPLFHAPLPIVALRFGHVKTSLLGNSRCAEIEEKFSRFLPFCANSRTFFGIIDPSKFPTGCKNFSGFSIRQSLGPGSFLVLIKPMCDCVIKVHHLITVQFHISRALMIVVPCKEAIAGEQLGLWSILSTSGDLHKFEVDSQDESLRRGITKLNLKPIKSSSILYDVA